MNEILEILKEKDNFIITSHIHPDGDSIGSQISLFLALKELKKNVSIFNEDSPPSYLSFLPYLDIILEPEDDKIADVAIILDTNEMERLGERTKKIVKKNPLKINIDHHIGKGIGDVKWISPEASSVCEMVYSIIKELSKDAISPDISLLLYVGIATDTGFFTFRNTTSKALRICADLIETGKLSVSQIKERLYSTKTIEELRFFGKVLEGLKEDEFIIWANITQKMVNEVNKEPETDSLLEALRSIKNALVFVLFRELSPCKTKVSLRSKKDFDVRRIALKFGGGGHLCAAGCILPLSLKEAEKEIIQAIKTNSI